MRNQVKNQSWLRLTVNIRVNWRSAAVNAGILSRTFGWGAIAPPIGMPKMENTTFLVLLRLFFFALKQTLAPPSALSICYSFWISRQFGDKISTNSRWRPFFFWSSIAFGHKNRSKFKRRPFFRPRHPLQPPPPPLQISGYAHVENITQRQ